MHHRIYTQRLITVALIVFIAVIVAVATPKPQRVKLEHRGQVQLPLQ